MADALVGSLRVVLTANTAEYKAAMSAAAKSTEVFQAAVEDAKRKLGPLGANADAVGKQFQRLSTAFSGTKLIQDAQIAAAAIEKIGGASRLTAAELQKWAPILDKAREKARLMGDELPAAFHKTADAVKAQAAQLQAATKQTTAWGGALGSVKNLAMGFAAGFTLDRIVMGIGRAVSETIAWGGAIVDLSAKTGVSTQTLQRWEYAAKQSGNTLDQIVTASLQLSKRIEEGDKAVEEAVAGLGLSMSQLRQLKPEEQFNLVADALAKTSDQGQRASAAMALFGRSGADLLPTLTADMKKLGDEAERLGAVVDDETLKAMDELGDSWQALKDSGRGLLATVLGPMVPALNDIAAAARNATAAFREDFWGAAMRFSAVGAGGPMGLGAMFGAAFRGRTNAAPTTTPTTGPPVPFSSHAGDTVAGVLFKDIPQASSEVARASRDAASGLRQVAAASAVLKDVNIADRFRFGGVGPFQGLPQVPGSLLGGTAVIGGAVPWGGIGQITDAMGWNGNTGINPGAFATRGGFNWGALGLGGLGAALPYLSQLVTGGSRAGQIGGTVGGSLGGVLGSSSLFGGLKGLGGFAGFLGSAAPFMGPLLGLVGGLLGKLFGPSEGRQASQARGQWIAGMGGGEAFNQRFRDAQVRPEEARRLTMNLMSATSRKEVEAAQQAIETALARNNALLAEQEQIESQIASVEAERQQLIDSLKVGYSDVLSIAQKYNLNVQGLGAAINQSGTTANFTAIINDLEALKRAAEQAGGELDWGGALSGMKEEINALVLDAMKMGTAIPENMRPFIDELLRTGQLLDENGEKMTDLGDLTWGAAVETDAQKVNTALEKIDKTLAELNQTLQDIAAALRGDLPNAARAGAQATEDAINGIRPRPIVVRVDYDDPGYEPPDQVSPYAEGGVVGGVQYRSLGGSILALADRWRPRGTDTVPAMLTPGELVLTRDQQRGLAGAMSAASLRSDTPANAVSTAPGVERGAPTGIDADPIQAAVTYSDDGSRQGRPDAGVQPSRASRGGVVPQYRNLGGTILALADRWRPRGKDTVPAMLTPGELVLTREQQRGLAGAVSAASVQSESPTGQVSAPNVRSDSPAAPAAAAQALDPGPIAMEVTYGGAGSQGQPRDGGASPYHASGGGVVPQYRSLGGAILALAERWRPRGTDTVPAMLTPGELVLTLEQQRGLAGAVAAAGVTPDSQGRAGVAGITEQTVVVVDGRGSKEDVLERIMAALPRKTRQNDRGFRTLMRDALGVA